jgi:hypothetical protein
MAVPSHPFEAVDHSAPAGGGNVTIDLTCPPEPMASDPLPTCPECGEGHLVAMSNEEGTNLFCPTCATCWHVELGWVSRVDPATCPGCAHRALCTASRRPYGTVAASVIQYDPAPQ